MGPSAASTGREGRQKKVERLGRVCLLWISVHHRQHHKQSMGLSCNDLLGVNTVIWEQITLYSLVIVVPPVVFLLFLLYKLKASLQILRETADVRAFRASSLAFLWLVCIVNIGRMIIQVLVTSFTFILVCFSSPNGLHWSGSL